MVLRSRRYFASRDDMRGRGMVGAKNYYVYILTNGARSPFYTGVTSDLIKRVYEHKNKLADGFTKKYNIDKLLYYETHDDVEAAIKREKAIKRWTRVKKAAAIEEMNPQWLDLYETII